MNNLSSTNRNCVRLFRLFSLLYDPATKYYIQPRIHKAGPKQHQSLWKELVGSVQNAGILDLACGTDGLIDCMDRENAYTGLDLSYAMLKKAARRAGQKGFSSHRLVRANAEKEVFAPNSFDLIVTDTALHMIPDWQKALAAAAKSLAPDGRLVCTVPVLGIDAAFDRGWDKYSRRPNFHALTEKDLQTACQANGLAFTRQATNGGVLYFTAHRNIMR